VSSSPLGPLDVFGLRLQLFLDRLVFPFLGLSILIYVRYIRRARFARLQELRAEYRELMADKRPTLICANHLTNFDTLFLNYGLGSLYGYMREFRLIPWNVPAAENFTVSLFLRALTYFGKCIAVDRWGDNAHHEKVRARLRWLMERGEPVNMFIEGGRSRTGRVEPENAVYGPGRLYLEVPNARVLCIYMRGEKQEAHTTLPAVDQEFYMALETIEPTSDQKGLRGGRDIAGRIIRKLKAMEDAYFAGRT
jgi:1-acyl-sn-glycerol-3-phosphate acyltransferase